MSVAPVLTSILTPQAQLATAMAGLYRDLEVGMASYAALHAYYGPQVRDAGQALQALTTTHPNLAGHITCLTRFSLRKTSNGTFGIMDLRAAAGQVYETVAKDCEPPFLTALWGRLEDGSEVITWDDKFPPPRDIYVAFQGFSPALQDRLGELASQVVDAEQKYTYATGSLEQSPKLLRATVRHYLASVLPWVLPLVSEFKVLKESGEDLEPLLTATHPWQKEGSITVREVANDLREIFQWLATTPAEFTNDLFYTTTKYHLGRPTGIPALRPAVDLVNLVCGENLVLGTEKRVTQRGDKTLRKGLYQIRCPQSDVELMTRFEAMIPEPHRTKMIESTGIPTTRLFSSVEELSAGLAVAVATLNPLRETPPEEQVLDDLITLRVLFEALTANPPLMPQRTFFQHRVVTAGVPARGQRTLVALINQAFGTRFRFTGHNPVLFQEPATSLDRETVVVADPAEPPPLQRDQILAQLTPILMDLIQDVSQGKKRRDVVARHRAPFSAQEGNLRVLGTLEPTLLEATKRLISLGKGIIPGKSHLGCLVDLRVAAEAVLALADKDKTMPERSGFPYETFHRLPKPLQRELEALLPEVGRQVYRTSLVSSQLDQDPKLFAWAAALWLEKKLGTLHQWLAKAEGSLLPQPPAKLHTTLYHLSCLLEELVAAPVDVTSAIVRWLNDKSTLKKNGVAPLNKLLGAVGYVTGQSFWVERQVAEKHRIHFQFHRYAPDTMRQARFAEVIPEPALRQLLCTAARLDETILLQSDRIAEGLATAFVRLIPHDGDPEEQVKLQGLGVILRLFTVNPPLLEQKFFFNKRLVHRGISVEQLKQIIHRINTVTGNHWIVIYMDGRMTIALQTGQPIKTTAAQPSPAASRPTAPVAPEPAPQQPTKTKKPPSKPKHLVLAPTIEFQKGDTIRYQGQAGIVLDVVTRRILGNDLTFYRVKTRSGIEEIRTSLADSLGLKKRRVRKKPEAKKAPPTLEPDTRLTREDLRELGLT